MKRHGAVLWGFIAVFSRPRIEAIMIHDVEENHTSPLKAAYLALCLCSVFLGKTLKPRLCWSFRDPGVKNVLGLWRSWPGEFVSPVVTSQRAAFQLSVQTGCFLKRQSKQRM